MNSNKDETNIEIIVDKAENVHTTTMNNTHASSEITIIDYLVSFLQDELPSEAKEWDPNVIRNLAASFHKRIENTSSGALQDVTMDHSYGVGYRSPCVTMQKQSSPTTPPTQGRAVREYEEQMATLRKENFNLKLKLYFMEESIPGFHQAASSTEGQENLMKQLIDFKIEMENLRRDLREKQQLVNEAGEAILRMENEYKDSEAKNRRLIDELQHKIQNLEMEQQMGKSEFSIQPEEMDDDERCQKIHELEDIVKEDAERIQGFEEAIKHLEENEKCRDETVSELNEKLKQLEKRNAELVNELENKHKVLSKTENLREELQQYKIQLADKTCMLQEVEEKLQDKSLLCTDAYRTIHRLMIDIKKKQEEITKLQSADLNKAIVMEKEKPAGGDSDAVVGNLSRSMSDSDALNAADSTYGQCQKHYEAIIEEKNQKIKRLEAEIKKKTANLQGLVNNELWEKNREIERLTKMLNASSIATPLSPTGSANINPAASELQSSFSDVEYTKALERNKLLQRKVDVLIQRIANDCNNESQIKELKNDLEAARRETENSEKWRRECADVCTVLSNRLEELAGFLNSLLKHKDVLGVLGADKRRAMRKAVDRSLDLSKSLNMSLSITGLSIIDNNLAELSTLSGLLCVDDDFDENPTFNSHEKLTVQQSIESLQAENKALKRELNKRASCDGRKERRSLPAHLLDNQSESEAWSEPDRMVSLARIGLDDQTSPNKELLLANSQKPRDTDSESEDGLNMSRNSKNRTKDRTSYLEQMIAQRDERILEIQCLLVEADNRLKKENLRVIELEQLTKCTQNDESTLFRQIEEKTRSLRKIQEERDHIADEVRLRELQISALKSEIEAVKMNHQQAIAIAASEEQRKLETYREELEQEMQNRLEEQEQIHKETLERDWIARSLYEASEIQLKELEKQLAEAQHTIANMVAIEQQLEQLEIEKEKMERSLKQQIDESTLQASKAVLERTKAVKDKRDLEKQVEDMKEQLRQHELRRNALQEQITQLEMRQESLQKEIARMHDKRQINKNITSDNAQSGYTSEEVPQPKVECKKNSIDRKNNSSPDLGIESDAGRVSSVELSNVRHSQLKTVEINTSGSKNWLNPDEAVATNANAEGGVDVKTHVSQLKTEKDDKSLIAALGQNATPTKINHDCAKVEQENAELRRKIIRTKRAFEDTYEKLRAANQKKAQIEKDIKNQILKTHNVLKNVRSNMENELS